MNIKEELEKHLQLSDDYYLEQDKDDKMKIYVWKIECEDMHELIGSYILENDSFGEMFEVGKEILNDIWV